MKLYEHPFASYCWKALIAFYECEVAFERQFVGGPEDRAELARRWPLASIPVLEDGDLVLPESTTIVEYAAPALVTSLQARLWDRIVDGHVATPMQKIVLDSLRAPDQRDPEGVRAARAELEQAYALLDDRLAARGWLADETFSLADCAAAPALYYARVVHRWDEAALAALTAYFARLTARPSVARVIEEARPYRVDFPLPWPDHVA
jgi:glutathione S-transferase